METAHVEPVMDPTKNDFSVDTAGPSFYESFSQLDYLQYPHSPYGASTINLDPDGSPRIGFNSLNLSNSGLTEYTYGSSNSFGGGSPSRSYTPTGSIFPGALTNTGEGSDLVTRARRGSGTQSPGPSVPPGSLAAVPRSHRFNPIAAPITRSSTRQLKKRARGEDFSDEEEEFQPQVPTTGGNNEVRREEIRRQRIESEQRRRDELRDGYRRLKDALPVSNQKSSKVSLLDRATTHIRYLEVTQQQLQTRLQQAEAETARLRHVNEALMLGTAEQRHAAAASAVAAAQQAQSSVNGF